MGDGEGSCDKAIVELDETMGLVCMLLNILPIMPGLGSMISACAGKGDFNCTALCFGICQFLTCWLLVGWIWSIMHGVWIYQASKKSKATEEPLIQ